MNPWLLRAGLALMLSASGLTTIAMHEEFRSEAYRPLKTDRATIGFGSTYYADGSAVKMGDTITVVKALVLLTSSTDKLARQLDDLVKVPLKQHEVDVYISFMTNIGVGAFTRSTLLKKLNDGYYAGACQEIGRWVYHKGKKVQGLINRRKREMEQCFGL